MKGCRRKMVLRLVFCLVFGLALWWGNNAGVYAKTPLETYTSGKTSPVRSSASDFESSQGESFGLGDYSQIQAVIDELDHL